MGRKCNCQNPPGGGIDCPSDSLAICRRVNGECRGYCRQIPYGLNKQELDNWVLRIIKDDNRSLNQLLSVDDKNILNNKQFITTTAEGMQLIIRFDFPVTEESGSIGMYGEVEVDV